VSEVAACDVYARRIETPIMAHVISAADFIRFRNIVLPVHGVFPAAGAAALRQMNSSVLLPAFPDALMRPTLTGR
jgi:hypothetical protein